jgi:Leucine-rich repeat (LRR) protein
LGLTNLRDIRLNDNKIQYLHPDLFLRVSSLSSLYLKNNPMMNIPTDRHFINSPSLRQLYISDCNISSISVETFANVSGLELLDLSGSHLKYIDVNILTILPQLSTFHIYENPLQCVCQLQEVWRWCQNHNIKSVHYEYTDGDHKRFFSKHTSGYVGLAIKKYFRFLTYVQSSVYAVLFTFGATRNG